MKKLLFSILGILLLFSCGEKKGSGGIVLYNNKVEIDTALKGYAKAYTEESGVNVTIKTCGGGCDYSGQIKAEFQSDREPDIFVIEGTGGYDVWSHKILELTGEPWTADTDLSFSIDGKIYGFPVAIEGWGMGYNAELLREAGVDPASLNFLGGFQSAFSIIDSNKEALGIDSVVSMAAGPEMYWVTGLHNFNGYLTNGLSYNDTSVIDDLNRGVVWQDRLEQLAEWAHLLFQYADERVLLQGNYDDQVNAFINGKAIFIHQGNWIDPNLLDGGVNFEIGYVPHGTLNQATDGIFIGAPSFYVVNKDGTNVDEAKAFLTAMASTESGHNYMVNEANMVPAFKSVTLKPNSPLSAAIMEWNSQGKAFSWQQNNMPDGLGMQTLGPIYNQLALGNIDTAKFVELVAREIEKLRS